jgi:membrane-anchored glycerophosphoryl diester phosphodiesterase (GDPDase)
MLCFLSFVALYLFAGFVFANQTVHAQLKEDPAFFESFAAQFYNPVSPQKARVLFFLAFVLLWLPIALKVFVVDVLTDQTQTKE